MKLFYPFSLNDVFCIIVLKTVQVHNSFLRLNLHYYCFEDSKSVPKIIISEA